MARNQDLYKAGIEVLESILSRQGIPATEVDKAQLGVDEDERVRLHLGNIILYAYDFRVGKDTKERFEGAVSRTKSVAKNPFPLINIERFVAQGVVANQISPDVDVIGWYLTQLPGES